MSYYSRKILIGTVGIYISHITLSYLAQRLFNTQFSVTNPKNQQQHLQRFQYPSLVTWIGCLFCSIYGLLYAHFVDKQQNLIPVQQRIRLGLLYTLNYLPTNYSLLFISYPLQVVGKNARYILVVVVGIFFSRVKKSKELKLPISKLFIGILISPGAALFMFYETKKQAKSFHLDPLKRWIGYVLLLIAVICDALFSDSQAYCKASFKPSPNQLFLASNLYGFMFIFAFSIIIGQLRTSIVFCMNHPSVIIQLVLIGMLQVAGQISVYYVISNFKQHIYPLISTTRKILTILFSIFLFNHKLNPPQWFSLIIVFASMGYELYDQIQSQQHNRQVRKNRLQKSYITQSQVHQSSKFGSQQDQSARFKQSKASQNSKSELVKKKSMRNSRNKLQRVNNFITKELLPAKFKEEESLSKYRYNWRMDEVVEDRETSLTPIKKIADI